MNLLQVIPSRLQKIFTSPVFTYGVFWSWNLLYLILFVTLEFSTDGMVIGLIRECIYGKIPLSFFLSAMIAYLVPFASIVLGITVLRKDRSKLLKLFYGVEIPLTILCLLRISLLREFNPGTLHLFLLISIGMLGLLWELLRKKENNSPLHTIIKFVIAGAQFCTGLYIAAVLIFYTPPIVVGLTKGFFSFEWLELWRVGFVVFIGILFFLYSLTMLAGLPLAMFIIYTRSFFNQFSITKNVLGNKIAYWMSTAFFSINLILFVVLNWWQPQMTTYEVYRQMKDAEHPEKVFHENEAIIKRGLVNAYLSEYRYLGSTERNDHIAEIYEGVIGGEDEDYMWLQEINNAVLKPFLYDGKLAKDGAGELYEKFFDTPIQKGERELVVSALNATWERDQAEAGILNVNEKKIHVNRQEITVTENKGWADIELHEVYENMTYDRLEGLYYFSLPDNAVITGLWLSDDSTIKKYTYRVSPRGAAQQVYREQVQQSFDPSLLEQTGPGTYRLRAFPILGRSTEWRRDYKDREYHDGPPFHLWLSYRVIANGHQEYLLPQVLERRNFYCDSDTEFLINGQAAEKEDDEDWLIATLPAASAAPTSLLFPFSDKQSIAAKRNTAAPAINIGSGTIGVLVDATYSMKDNLPELERELKILQEQNGVKAELYAYNMSSLIMPLEMDKIENQCFGNNDLLSILTNFDQKHHNKKYTALFFFTDEAGYESDNDSLKSLFPNYPVYIIHVNGLKSHAYADALLETIAQSHGQICTSSTEALQALSFRKQQQLHPELMSQRGDYTWSLSTNTNGTSSPLSAVAGYEYILHEASSIPKDSLLGHMDLLHNIAMKYEIVSPFSSMIVLVNEEQQRRLDELEQQEDRFKRETETGKENISSPGSPLHFGEVTGTPEPEEWMLMGLAGCLMIYVYYKKKRKVAI